MTPYAPPSQENQKQQKLCHRLIIIISLTTPHPYTIKKKERYNRLKIHHKIQSLRQRFHRSAFKELFFMLKNKKPWRRPRLIIIARGNPEENVLGACVNTNPKHYDRCRLTQNLASY
ncbi:MAG: hypothetical protein JW832_09230 [Deltaproteobacteria bacterium]|nr:hypothetical protein [Deltaproteobacteria bacterium]